jgi:hypothetical protein
MKTKGNFTFFFRKEDMFSNWYERSFTVKGETFVTGEQFMMYAKAMLFKDSEIAQKILQTNDPAEQKRLGRQVKGFDQKTWDERCVRILAAGLYHKFNQHEDLKKALLGTGSTILVEASPYDKIWGIGLSADDPRAMDPKQWKGKNLLGKVLTMVRERLLECELTCAS